VTDLSGAWVGVERDIVTVFGADARSYLHGQVSQDTQSLGAGDSRWTLVLAPNGRVEVLARVSCVGDDRFELDTEAGYGDVLAARLDRFRIRVKAELERAVVELFAPLSNIGESSVQESVRSAHQSRVGWWNTGQWMDAPPSGASSAGATVDDYERARIEAGWPAMGSEIVPGERIPAEVAVVPVTVSFTKGCYPGQELVERMHSRGSQAPRQLRIVEVGDGAKPGDPVADPDDPQGAAIGAITSVAGAKALAYVKRGAAVGEVPGPINC
jgi:tRNA-modifying protein YgfZ